MQYSFYPGLLTVPQHSLKGLDLHLQTMSWDKAIRRRIQSIVTDLFNATDDVLVN